MKKEELIALLQQPATITDGQTTALKEVLEEYPYFQAARALFLKGLKNRSSLHYNRELKITAAHTLDRGVLFDYITSEEFNQNEVSNRIKQYAEEDLSAPEQSDADTAETLSLNEALRMKLKESEQVFDPELFSPFRPGKKPIPNTGLATEKPTQVDDPLTAPEETAGETQPTEEERTPETTTSTSSDSPDAPDPLTDTGKREEDLTADKQELESLDLGQPLSFPKEESHSFSEWLRLTRANPINREQEPAKAPESQSRKFKLIDQFISKSPRIIPSKTPSKPKLVEMEQSAPEALMTETLARVYLEQKNYKKAIQAYKILILKNPEKSGFFADQIRAITKLQEQNS